MRQWKVGDRVNFLEEDTFPGSGEVVRINEPSKTAVIQLKDSSTLTLHFSELRFISSAEQRERAAARKSMQESIMRDLGLKKVRGALGGTYWE